MMDVTDLLKQVDLSKASPGDWFVTMRLTDTGQYAGFDICSNSEVPNGLRRVAILPDGQMPHQRANARILAAAPKMLSLLRRIESATTEGNTQPAWLSELKKLLTEEI